jgi:hypothetical protein
MPCAQAFVKLVSVNVDAAESLGFPDVRAPLLVRPVYSQS